ncbi:MAG: hypothetical protein EXR62_02390 [Chloroflexi bacterium]|nr:hypothetical protein [Chloroflexota bacterium]
MRRSLAVLCLIILFAQVQLTPDTISAQSPDTSWSLPKLLYQSNFRVSDPVIVTDIYDTVHIFWTEGPQKGQENDTVPVIYHTSLENGAWSTPQDVLISPGGGTAGAPEVAAGPFGKLHLIWQGPNNTLFYSNVDARLAADSRAWSSPKSIGLSLTHAGITTDANGRIYIVYPDASGNKGIYYTFSTDTGKTWSSPINVSAPVLDNSGIDYTQIAVDALGNIHVVWSEFKYPDAWPPLGIFYARSTDGGAHWSTPTKFAGASNVQAIIRVSDDNVVHVVWNGAVEIGGRYYIRSQDGGNTWSNVTTIVPLKQGGTSGYSDFRFDSANVIHVISPINGIDYLRRENGSWSPIQKISGDLKAPLTGSIEYPRITVSQGNFLHVVFEVDFQKIYYTGRTTGAPIVIAPPPRELPAAPSPAVTTPSPLPTTPAVHTPTPTILSAGQISAPPDISENPWLSIMVGVIPAGLLIVVLALFRFVYRARR